MDLDVIFSCDELLKVKYEWAVGLGEGFLVYLCDGDVLIFMVSFSPIFSRMGVSKEDHFPRASCQSMSKGEINFILIHLDHTHPAGQSYANSYVY